MAVAPIKYCMLWVVYVYAPVPGTEIEEPALI